MNGFIEWLESLNKQDSKVRAILRRSLSFEPGEFVPAFPYVEPFVKDEKNFWRRKIYYLIAAVWAEHWREAAQVVQNAASLIFWMPISINCQTAFAKLLPC
jgi:hypothetical protein